ncbi:hypothetical protein AAE02nite_17390 [Adhaeribacter aerolatus]|uniref:GmrSD restriction endonucleases N-terminal domain-containing protein n=1 Tax=Adhaeribacter aerolatus TaxID=670289 RepID=A0A512AWI9_9BACT|nr:DUF262 domain-containing protein [Adhaeribacter aerolatus]GEO04075.1 hypothetical protein AAE02nite_17390 [Adhaeribacter aerolatus]
MDFLAQLSELKRQVDFNTYDISVKELISMHEESIINIAPDYQRQFRWKDERQSALIESILLGIPTPSLYMATNLDGTWELIDGVQRLSTIIHFAGTPGAKRKILLDNSLVLTGLKKLSTFIGKSFEALPKTVQLDFLLKPMKVTTLSDKSDLQVRFDLFERLNTGGIILSNQEIRSCVYRGAFNDFLKELAKDQNYKKVVKVSSTQESDGTREEYVLRFFAYLNNYQNFEHSVVDFLNEFMGKATKKFDYKEGEYIFRETFRQLAGLPNGITRGKGTTPANLFEGIAVGAALAIKEAGQLKLNNTREWIEGPELRYSTTGATNSKPRVEHRIMYSKTKFLGL